MRAAAEADAAEEKEGDAAAEQLAEKLAAEAGITLEAMYARERELFGMEPIGEPSSGSVGSDAYGGCDDVSSSSRKDTTPQGYIVLDVNSTMSEAESSASEKTLAMGMPPGKFHSGFWDKQMKSTVEYFCQKCENILDPSAKGVRVTSKAPMAKYVCGTCNSKTVGLSTLFGGWPIDDFKGLSQEEQVAFWKEADTAVGMYGLKKLVERHVARRVVLQKINAKEGVFQPLTFWSRKGYDVAYIEEHCDSEWSPDLGAMTYRVRLHKETSRSIDEGIQEHMAKLLGNKELGGAAEQPDTCKKRRASLKGKAKAKEEPEDEEGAEDAEEDDAEEVCM